MGWGVMGDLCVSPRVCGHGTPHVCTRYVQARGREFYAGVREHESCGVYTRVRKAMQHRPSCITAWAQTPALPPRASWPGDRLLSLSLPAP